MKQLLRLGLMITLVGTTRIKSSDITNVPVLVTGGAGFIGSHLAQELIKQKAKVTILDNFSTGSKENLENIANQITLIDGDIQDFSTCLDATKGKAIVFHLAAAISVNESMEHPDHCFGTNVTGTLNMLEACKRNGVSRFVFSSSSAVYGPATGTCSEQTPCNPLSPYGTSKLMGEHACQSYALYFDTVCLRYFNVYGDRQNPNGAYAAVVAKFRHQMTHNKPITIFGDGLQTRDFISVDQVVKANIKVGTIDGQLVNGQVFNVGTGKSINLLELIEKLKQEFPDYNQTPTFAPERDGDIKNSSANCSKFQQLP